METRKNEEVPRIDWCSFRLRDLATENSDVFYGGDKRSVRVLLPESIAPTDSLILTNGVYYYRSNEENSRKARERMLREGKNPQNLGLAVVFVEKVEPEIAQKLIAGETPVINLDQILEKRQKEITQFVQEHSLK